MAELSEVMGWLCVVSIVLILIGAITAPPIEVNDLLFGNVFSLFGTVLGFGVIILFAFELSRTRKD